MFKILQNPKISNFLFTRSGVQNFCFRLATTKSDASPTELPTKTSSDSSVELSSILHDKEKLLAKLKEDLPKPYDGPERDLVNFPRKERAVYPGIIRHGFIPQEWLDFFYKKTGVTGPYFFGFGLLTFLASKEWYVFEEETSTAISLFLITYIGFKKFGPTLRKYGEGFQQDQINEFENIKNTEMKMYEDSIESEKKMQWQSEGARTLIQAKRENVHMQLETEYRKRMMDVYGQVKRRLDYFLDMDNTRRKLQQKYMVDWIVQNVMKSITPQQEKDALQKCIADLKVLSAHAV